MLGSVKCRVTALTTLYNRWNASLVCISNTLWLCNRDYSGVSEYIGESEGGSDWHVYVEGWMGLREIEEKKKKRSRSGKIIHFSMDVVWSTICNFLEWLTGRLERIRLGNVRGRMVGQEVIRVGNKLLFGWMKLFYIIWLFSLVWGLRI